METIMRALPLSLAAALLLGGCATGDRGLVSPHQPIVRNGVATVSGCPDWSSANAQGHEGQSSNYGCATAVNLAAMIADPNDLIHGRADTGDAADQATRAIKAWRETAPSSKLWAPVTTQSSKPGGN